MGGVRGSVGCLFPPLGLQDNPLSIPKRKVTESEATAMNLKYYSSEIHTASFVLPRFMEKVTLFSEQDYAANKFHNLFQ